MNYNEMEEAYHQEKAKTSSLEKTITGVLETLGELKESFLGMEVQQDALVEINKEQEKELTTLKVECERLVNLGGDQLNQLITLQCDVGNQVMKVTDIENRLMITECDAINAKADSVRNSTDLSMLNSTVMGLTGMTSGEMVASQQFVRDSVNRECSQVFDEVLKELPYAVDDVLDHRRKQSMKKEMADWDDDDKWDADGYPKHNYA